MGQKWAWSWSCSWSGPIAARVLVGVIENSGSHLKRQRAEESSAEIFLQSNQTLENG
uniref:Uncharacterized protein n=1 Tax=Vitis vinifera TaxID=29760 RepID=F6HC59_VITVI